MLFNSLEFIFLFLPATLLGYALIGRFVGEPIVRIVWLAAASLTFYAAWNVTFLPVIIVSIIANYYFGALLGNLPLGARVRTATFVLALAANVAAIAFFKYANFGLSIFAGVTHSPFTPLAIVLPLGISFFTFTQIAYLADVYGGYTRESSFAKYALFVTYFPHLVAGPILHHREMMPQFGEARLCTADRVAQGLSIFAIGLFKKVVIADGFSILATAVFTAAGLGNIATGDAWCGAFAYSLQIYFDFSGYSDMAIGLSIMFGIALPFNFDSPYKSRSIIEFWRRWHITLSRFLRDYLYIPIGGSRHGEARRYLNLAITMLLGGLWHGAGWTFIVWGGLHGLFLIINHGWAKLQRRSPAMRRAAGTIAYALLALVLTQLCVVIAWVFFRSTGVGMARRIFLAMFHIHRHLPDNTSALAKPIDALAIVAGYLVCLCMPNVNEMFRKWRVGLTTYENPPRWSVLSITWRSDVAWLAATTGLVLVSLLGIVFTGNGTPFLYFQF